jgi:putative oxidoreductase
MNEKLHDPMALAARILLALIFVVSGFGKITGFDGTVGYMAAKGMPMPQVLAVGAIAIEFLGGLMLVVGWKTRFAALAIFAFIIPTTIIFHNPIGAPADQVQAQMINVMKNLSIMGGMLMLAVFGPGAWSLDKR